MAMEQRPHLLAIPFPAQGHINPMFQLCTELESQGIFITFVLALNQENLIAARPAGTNFRFAFLPKEFAQPTFKVTTNPTRFVYALEHKIRSAVPKMVQELMEDASTPPLTCLVSDSLLVSPREIAQHLGLRHVSLVTFAASWVTIQDSLRLLRDRMLLPLKGTSLTIDFIPGMPPIRSQDFPSQIQEVDAADVGFEFRMHRNDILKTDAWVLLNTFKELEPSQLEYLRNESPQFVPVGPLLPSSAFPEETGGHGDGSDVERLGFWQEEFACMDWLDKHPDESVVYVSIGSLAAVSIEQLKEVFKGLENSGQPYLWVLRLDMINDVQVEELVRESKRGKFVSWAPQLKVLKHSSMAVFITHCGWNSVIEAVVARVPMLCWPFTYEQPLNCALAVEEWKAGLRLSDPGSFVTGEQVEASVREMLGDRGRQCKSNVLKLGIAAKTAVSESGDSKINMQNFVDDLKHRANKNGEKTKYVILKKT